MELERYSLVMYYAEKSDDIVFAELKNTPKVDLTIAKQLVAFRLDFTRNKKHFLITDISNIRHISSEAKEFLQRSDTGLKNILGAAFIASNPVSALIANIFIKTPKDFQAKFFSNKNDALDWIFEHRQKMILKIHR